MAVLKRATAYLRMFYLAGTGLGPAASISKIGGSFATPSGGAGMTEVGSGWYSLQLSVIDTDTLGELAYSFSNGSMSAGFVDQVAEGADPWAVPLPGAYVAGEAGYLLGHLAAPADPWAVPLPGAYLAGEAGYLLGHIGGGSDPWATLLPGSYTQGQAGNIVGTKLDASIKALIYYLATGRGLPPG